MRDGPMYLKLILVCGVLVCCLPGCALQEIRSKTKVGPEFRHKGSNSTNAERWTAQQGLEFKWDKGINTGLTYRRRDTNHGTGDNDNGVWFEFSFPLWKATSKKNGLERRVEALKERLATLEVDKRAGEP